MLMSITTLLKVSHSGDRLMYHQKSLDSGHYRQTYRNRLKIRSSTPQICRATSNGGTSLAAKTD